MNEISYNLVFSEDNIIVITEKFKSRLSVIGIVFLALLCLPYLAYIVYEFVLDNSIPIPVKILALVFCFGVTIVLSTLIYKILSILWNKQ